MPEGLIGYLAKPGTVASRKVAHSQEVYVHKAVTDADWGALSLGGSGKSIAGEDENIIETVYFGGHAGHNEAIASEQQIPVIPRDF